MKLYESLTETLVMPGLPLLARLDGRAFHTFTRGLPRPFDPRLTALMVATTKALVGEFDVIVGYTQSDEISLLWQQTSPASELLFGDRVLKLTSVLAATATAYFGKLLPEHLPEKRDAVPVFDGRVWNVPTRDEAANYFLWRERDATKNSVSMAAQHYFPHEELHAKTGSQMHEMLFSYKDVNWNDYPDAFKRGTFVRRRAVERTFTVRELEELPPRHAARTNPALLVTRHVMHAVLVPTLGTLVNRVGFLFEGEEPRTGSPPA